MSSKTYVVWMVFYAAISLTRIYAIGGCKNMVFKVKIEGKALKNHVFETIPSGSHEFCRILCYLDDRCLSYNYGTSANGDKGMCELNESDHVMNGEDLEYRPDTVYLRAENDCNCPEDKTCRYNFVDNSHYCVCKRNSTGTQCNVRLSTESPAEASSGFPSGPTNGSAAETSTASPTESSTGASSGSSGGTSTGSPAGSSTAPPTESSTGTSIGSSGGTSTGSTGSTLTGSPSGASTQPTGGATTLSTVTTSTGSTASATTVSTQSLTTQSTTPAQTTTASSSGSGCELQFATASTINMIKISKAFPTTLKMFTISFWLKVSSSSLTLYPFSYATTSQSSSLSIAIKEDGIMEVGLNGGGKSLQSHLKRNNAWQHLAVTWKSSTGNVKLYYNGGDKTSSESGLQDETVPTGGILIVGQYQGGYNSGFDATKTMQGNIAGLNFWSSEYTAAEVSSLYGQSCNDPTGDALSWDTILQGDMLGLLSTVCPATCPS